MSDAAQPVPIPIDEILVSERRRSIGDVSELADSIRELGLLNPITVTLDKKLVVGGRRLAAVKQLGWCEIRAFVKAYGALHAELAEIDENLMRLELTRLEHSEQMARRKEIYEALHPEAARPKGGRPAGNAEPISTFADDTAKKTGVTPRTVRQEVQIANDITPEAKDLIRETEAANSKTDLLALARVKDASAQKAVAQKVASGEAKSVVQAMRQYSRETRLRLGEERSRLTEGQYDVIYADPPWQYEQEQCKGTSLDHYPTMALAEICALEVNGKPVRELAAKDAVLFLWATAPKLAEALQVVEAWGFNYRTCAMWHKQGRLGIGHHFRLEHELLLLATRGEPGTPAPTDRPRSCHMRTSDTAQREACGFPRAY